MIEVLLVGVRSLGKLCINNYMECSGSDGLLNDGGWQD